MSELQKNYQPADVEDKWYQRWLEKKMFQADPAKGCTPYTILMLPSNISINRYPQREKNPSSARIKFPWNITRQILYFLMLLSCRRKIALSPLL